MAKTRTSTLRNPYNKSADVLYLAFGKPRTGIDKEVKMGVFVRVSAKTGRAVGMTIIDFEKRFSRPVSESVPIDLAKFLVAA